MDDSETYLQQHYASCSPSGSVTDTSFYDTASEDEGFGSPWFGLNTSITSLAKTVGKGIDSVARGAKSILNELAELENEALRGVEYSSKEDASDMSSSAEVTILPLPWEICLQSTDADLKVSIVQKEDEVLKERILDLSCNESAFSQPFMESSSDEDSFRLDDARVILIRRLLESDSRLGHMHAKLSGRSVLKETLFWQNFFYHCERLREERQKEINDENLRRASHDDELDAELVGRPPASCTGFYPRTGKLQACASSDSEGVYSGHTVPSIQENDSAEGFVVIEEGDVF